MNASVQTPRSPARFLALVAGMWLALPVMAYRYWSVWDRLPARMATHFGADGRPNGWMTPPQSLRFSLIFLTVLLTVFTAISLYTVRRSSQLDAAAWSLLGLFYVVLGLMTYISDAVLQYNLSQAPISVAGIGLVLLLSTMAFVVIFITSKRGATLSFGSVISEETHASATFAVICLIPAALMLMLAANAVATGLRLTFGAGVIVTLACAAMAWSGFQYVFTPAGIEIRTLGFRLRSIPLRDIKSYAVDHWRALGGYGIRGVGDTRAYVWANSGVRIKLNDGEVFLGHTEPGRIIHDLDVMMSRKATSNEGHPPASLEAGFGTRSS
ncbi:MAG TPA: DUF1648 domain-containing protein [Terriglobales bacterium]|nr:DUF1648 domain-containing protein [Terriglobales bacterium]